MIWITFINALTLLITKEPSMTMSKRSDLVAEIASDASVSITPAMGGGASASRMDA